MPAFTAARRRHDAASSRSPTPTLLPRTAAWQVQMLAIILTIGVVLAAAAPAAAAAPFRVVLDAGHGGRDPGATSGLLAAPEKEITLHLALLAGTALQRRGVEVEYTRADDRYVPLEARADLARRLGAAALISLHLNAAPDAAASGLEVWHGTGPRDQPLAAALLANLSPVLRAAGEPNRGGRSGPELAVLHAPVPAALVELGFMTNQGDAQLLAQGGFLTAAAEALAAGVVEFRDGRPPADSHQLLAGLGQDADPHGAIARILDRGLAANTWTAVQGDTLSGIAVASGVALRDLVQLNGIADPDRILAGQALRLPGPVGASLDAPPNGSTPPGGSRRTPLLGAAQTYTVLPGETLSAIGLRVGVSPDELARWNHLQDPGLVRAGQQLRLRPEAVPASTAKAAGTTLAIDESSRRYVVVPGDTLSEIALRQRVSVASLAKANGLTQPDLVLAGKALVIPTPGT